MTKLHYTDSNKDKLIHKGLQRNRKNKRGELTTGEQLATDKQLLQRSHGNRSVEGALKQAQESKQTDHTASMNSILTRPITPYSSLTIQRTLQESQLEYKKGKIEDFANMVYLPNWDEKIDLVREIIKGTTIEDLKNHFGEEYGDIIDAHLKPIAILIWKNSVNEHNEIKHAGGHGGNALQSWLMNGTEPADLNCWEYLLYIAVKIGKLTREAVKDIYFSEGSLSGTKMFKGEEFSSILDKHKEKITDPYAEAAEGDALLIIESARHVLLSLGGDSVAHLTNAQKVSITTLDEVITNQVGNREANLEHIKYIIQDVAKDYYTHNGDNSKSNQMQDIASEVPRNGLKDDFDKISANITSQLRCAGMQEKHVNEVKQRISEVANIKQSIYRVPANTWIDAINSYKGQ